VGATEETDGSARARPNGRPRGSSRSPRRGRRRCRACRPTAPPAPAFGRPAGLSARS